MTEYLKGLILLLGRSKIFVQCILVDALCGQQIFRYLHIIIWDDVGINEVLYGLLIKVGFETSF